MKCPTCGRRPSERVAIDDGRHRTRPTLSHCPDPIHRVADRSVAAWPDLCQFVYDALVEEYGTTVAQAGYHAVKTKQRSIMAEAGQ